MKKQKKRQRCHPFYVETFEGKDGWRWRLVRSGFILASSQAYATRSSAVRTVKSLMRSAGRRRAGAAPILRREAP